MGVYLYSCREDPLVRGMGMVKSTIAMVTNKEIKSEFGERGWPISQGCLKVRVV